MVDTTKPAEVNGNPNPNRYPTTTDKYVANMPGASGETHLGDYGWVKLDTDSGLITNKTKGTTFQGQAFPEFMQKIIQAEGLINYINQK